MHAPAPVYMERPEVWHWTFHNTREKSEEIAHTVAIDDIDLCAFQEVPIDTVGQKYKHPQDDRGRPPHLAQPRRHLRHMHHDGPRAQRPRSEHRHRIDEVSMAIAFDDGKQRILMMSLHMPTSLTTVSAMNGSLYDISEIIRHLGSTTAKEPRTTVCAGDFNIDFMGELAEGAAEDRRRLLAEWMQEWDLRPAERKHYDKNLGLESELRDQEPQEQTLQQHPMHQGPQGQWPRHRLVCAQRQQACRSLLAAHHGRVHPLSQRGQIASLGMEDANRGRRALPRPLTGQVEAARLERGAEGTRVRRRGEDAEAPRSAEPHSAAI